MQTSRKLAAMVAAFALLLVSCLFFISSPAEAGGYGFPKSTEDAAHASGDNGMMPLGVRNDTNAGLSGTDGDYTPFATTSEGFLKTSPQNGRMASYVIATDKFTPAASPTDIFEMSGSSSKTIYIQEISFSLYNNTPAGYYHVLEAFLLRRSTASSGGTSSTLTPRLLDTNDSASTVNTCKVFTANPTVGTLVGTLAHRFSSACINYPPYDSPCVLFKADTPSKALVLRGTSDFITLNFNGAYLNTNGGTLYVIVHVKYTEVTN